VTNASSRRRRGDERGAVSAEFAVALPAVVVVVALCLGAVGAVGRQVRLEQAVAQAARLVARGDAESRARDLVRTIAGADDIGIRAEGDLVCVTARFSPPPPLPSLRAESCALAGER